MQLIADVDNMVVDYTTKFRDFITDPGLWSGIAFVILKVFIIFLVARIINKIARSFVARLLRDREKKPMRIDPRRARTIGVLAENAITYTVNFIAVLLVLSQFNFNLGPLLAGAGVLGLAIGFGAQSIVKDIITGFFIIFEDQFAVGDVIQTGSYKGEVESIGLRVTTIRAWTGEVFIIPNSTITTVTNFSILNALAIVDFKFSYEADLEQAVGELQGLLISLHEKHAELATVPAIKGIQELGENTYSVRISMECLPNTRQKMIRELNQVMEQKLKEQQLTNMRGAVYIPDEKGW